MAVLFFDTSALVKRYDRTEAGSARVSSLCRTAAGHTIFLARVASLEIASALNRKHREGTLDREDRDRLWRLFRSHWSQQYRVLAVDEAIWRRAETLVFAHTLRAYDALQIATALRAVGLMANLTPDVRFCTADRGQAQAAVHEGLAVEVIS